MVLMDWCSYSLLGLDSSTPLSCNSSKWHVLLNIDSDLSLKLGVSFGYLVMTLCACPCALPLLYENLLVIIIYIVEGKRLLVFSIKT